MLCIPKGEYYEFEKEDTCIGIGGLTYEIIDLFYLVPVTIIYPLSGIKVDIDFSTVRVSRIKRKEIQSYLKEKCPNKIDLYKKVDEVYILVEEKKGKIKVRTIDDLSELQGKIRYCMSSQCFVRACLS